MRKRKRGGDRKYKYKYRGEEEEKRRSSLKVQKGKMPGGGELTSHLQATVLALPAVLPALYNFALIYSVLVVKYSSRCSWVYILLAVKRLAMNWAKQE